MTVSFRERLADSYDHYRTYDKAKRSAQLMRRIIWAVSTFRYEEDQ